MELLSFRLHSELNKAPVPGVSGGHTERNVSIQALKDFESLRMPFKRNFEEEDNRAHVVAYLNLYDPEYPLATAIGMTNVGEELQKVINRLGCRAWLLSEGYCIIGSESRPDIERFAGYAVAQGLVQPGDPARNIPDPIERTIFVDDACDIRRVLICISLAAGQSQEPQYVVPYYGAGDFYRLLSEVPNVVAYDGLTPAQGDVATRLYNKCAYRNLIQSIDEDAFHYTRFSIEAEREVSTPVLRHKLDEAITFASGYSHDFQTTGDRRLLFVQLATSGGGFGNWVVYQREDSSMYLAKNKYCSDRLEYRDTPEEDAEDQLISYLKSLHADIEVAPYLEIEGEVTYSFGLAVGDDGVTVLGPREQIVDPVTKSFEGWQVSTDNPPGKFVDLDRQLEIALKYGMYLHEQGWRGLCDEDLMQYRDPEGKVRVARVESNMRRDAVSFVLGIVLSDERLKEDFLQGKVSIRQYDHRNIAADVVAKAPDALALAEYLVECGIPAYSQQSPYGVLFLTPPAVADASGNAECILVIIAPDDVTRDAWDERIGKALETK